MAENIILSEVLNRNDARAEYELGEVINKDGKTLQYVQVEDSDGGLTAAAGQVVYVSANDTNMQGHLVTKYIDEGVTTSANDVTGVLLTAVTEGHFTFMQTYGYTPAIQVESGELVYSGDLLIGIGDGTCATAENPLITRSFGYATADADQSAGTVAAFLTIQR